MKRGRVGIIFAGRLLTPPLHRSKHLMKPSTTPSATGNPEWAQPDGSCSQCAVYEYELVEEMAGRRRASEVGEQGLLGRSLHRK
jgi:hypothetical protein